MNREIYLIFLFLFNVFFFFFFLMNFFIYQVYVCSIVR